MSSVPAPTQINLYCRDTTTGSAKARPKRLSNDRATNDPLSDATAPKTSGCSSPALSPNSPPNDNPAIAHDPWVGTDPIPLLDRRNQLIH